MVKPAIIPVTPEGELSDHPYVPRHSSRYSSSPAPVFSSLKPETDELSSQTDESAKSFTAPPHVEAQESGLAKQKDATEVTATDKRLPALIPHRAWHPHRVLDVRSSPRQQVIIEEIIDIVAAEGPVITERIYELYLRASGGIRVTKPIRDALGEATAVAVKRGQVKQIQDRLAGRWIKTLYLPQTPSIVLRSRGDRELEDIPPTEVADLARRILNSDPSVEDNELKRLILTAFDRKKMTAPASRFLDGCIALARRHGE